MLVRTLRAAPTGDVSNVHSFCVNLCNLWSIFEGGV
jgi:hypothetical protein